MSPRRISGGEDFGRSVVQLRRRLFAGFLARIKATDIVSITPGMGRSRRDR
jgi:hypothetical protein